jgi:hypothetical protein
VAERSEQLAIGRGADTRIAYVIDAKDRRLYVRLTGLWSDQVFIDFLRDFRAAMRKLASSKGERAVLCDATAWPVQPQRIATQFSELISAPFGSSTRMALVCPSALLAMQVRRVAARPTMRIFPSIPEAMHWLATPG